MFIVNPLKNYVLGALAGTWLVDGMTLLMIPGYVMAQLRELLQQSPGILRWELLSIIGGLFLCVAAQDLPYQWLWIATAGGMIAKGAFLTVGPASWRGPVILWCVGREDIDYRFYGLCLCALAVLLLHALGWIGRN